MACGRVCISGFATDERSGDTAFDLRSVARTFYEHFDSDAVCLGLDPYVGDYVSSCASVGGNRFSVTLSPVHTGTYQPEFYAFFDRSAQYPTSSNLVIEVR